MSRVVKWLLRLGLAGIFIYAGCLKAANPVRFAHEIANYHLAPWPGSVGLAFYLPWLEIACGVALLLPTIYRGSLLILTGLISAFIVASAIAKARGLDVTCGCFGHVSASWSFSRHLLVDVAILAAVIVCWFKSSGSPFSLQLIRKRKQKAHSA